ncbi:MAG: methylenetetrahydrofolate reductase [NAD(P)H] [Gammaproteobacteria bacterium]
MTTPPSGTAASTHLSFEFFPPRSAEAVARLAVTRERLAALGPEFFSVTFGAGGSTRDLTLETVLELRAATGVDSAPHLSCIGFTAAGIGEILAQFRAAGIRRLVTLRGDMPSGSTGFGELRYANELVEFIRREAGDHFHVSVAAYPEVHPQAPGAAADLANFKRKVDAGADDAITQYFYNADAYFRFVDLARANGIVIDIVPGIMPITSFSGLKRFSDMCGAEIPRWMLKRLQDFGDDRVAIQAFGVDVATRLCEQLLAGGAPGLHFYTMNQHEAPRAICANLGLGGGTTG